MNLHLADRVIANSEGTPPRIATTNIGAGYFEALGLTMPRGREFTPADGALGAEAVIVNQRFAAQYWPGEDPGGRKIRLGQGPWNTVVGVSPPIRQTSLRPDVDALVYRPFRQLPTFWFSHHGTRPFPCVGGERAARGRAQAGSRPSAARHADG
jgi:hypothetical protein